MAASRGEGAQPTAAFLTNVPCSLWEGDGAEAQRALHLAAALAGASSAPESPAPTLPR